MEIKKSFLKKVQDTSLNIFVAKKISDELVIDYTNLTPKDAIEIGYQAFHIAQMNMQGNMEEDKKVSFKKFMQVIIDNTLE